MSDALRVNCRLVQLNVTHPAETVPASLVVAVTGLQVGVLVLTPTQKFCCARLIASAAVVTPHTLN